MDTINLAPFNHTIYSRQSFHVVMMTESQEELKLVGGDESQHLRTEPAPSLKHPVTQVSGSSPWQPLVL